MIKRQDADMLLQVSASCEKLRIAEDAGALSELCAAAKKREARDRITADLSADRLCALIKSEQPKVRKNAARLMGALGDKNFAEPLKTALFAEDTRYVRPSVILALGAIAPQALDGYEVQPPADEGESKHYEAELEALRTVRMKTQEVAMPAFTGLKRPHVLELRCADGLEAGLIRELDTLKIAHSKPQSGRLTATVDDMERLFSARSFYEALFPIARGVAATPEELGKHIPGIEKLISEATDGKPPFAFRMEVTGEKLDRKSFISRALRDIPDTLINSTSSYSCEVRAEINAEGRMDVFYKLWCFKDTRFDYRAKALPASIHPAVAAAMLKTLQEYLKPGASVLDPCCGSGTLLIERARLGACTLTGVDIAKDALAICTENAKLAKVKVCLFNRDCAKFEGNPAYDEVIANLPFGIRVGTHDNNERLYRKLVQNLPNWLVPDGIAILYTTEGRLLSSLLRSARELTLVKTVRIGAGGLSPHAYVIRRK